MTTEFNWSWVNTVAETAKESGAVLQDGGTVFSLRQAHNGQVSGSDLNAFSSSVGQNFQSTRSNWRLYTRPILNSLPSGGSDGRWATDTGKALPDKIDCFKYGIQGTTLFVFNDANSTKADGRYWVTDEYRPKTIAEAFEDIHSDLSDISDSLNTDIIVDLDPLWAAIGEDYRDSSKVSSSGALDTRVSTTESYLNQLNTDIYEPATYAYALGTPLPYSIAAMLDELLQLHNGGGWGSDPSTISHTGVSVAAHTHPHTDIIPGLTQSLVQARVAPYTSLENDILRIRYEIQQTRGSSSWYTDTVDPVGGGAASLAAHIGYTGGGASTSNPHDIDYADTGAGAVFDVIRTYTGMTSNSDVDPSYSSTTVVTQGDNLTLAIGKLDAAVLGSGHWSLGSEVSDLLSPTTITNGMHLDATNDIHLETTTDIDIVGGTSLNISTSGGPGNMTIGTSGGAQGNLYLRAYDSGDNTIYIQTNLSGSGDIHLDANGNSGNINIYAADGVGTSGSINIKANDDHGTMDIEAIGGLSIGQSNGSGADWSVAFGKYTNAPWYGSIYASNSTFDTDYTDGSGQIISTVLTGETTTNIQFLEFGDTSALTIPNGQYLYIDFRIVCCGESVSSRASFSGKAVFQRADANTPALRLDYSSVVKDSGAGGSSVIQTPSIIVAGTDIRVQVETTGANTFRWTCAISGVYSNMFPGVGT